MKVQAAALTPFCSCFQGIAVFAVEHTDGSASTAALAAGHGFLYNTGWGDDAERNRQIR